MPSTERRRATRIPADFPIRLTSDGPAREGKLRDLSEIGLGCDFPAPVEEMTVVKVALQLPGDQRLLDVQGAVVRCEKMAGSAGYDVAIYFTEVPAATSVALKGWAQAEEPRELGAE